MDKKEAEAQDALGLMKKYLGYITLDYKNYIRYEIKAITRKSGHHRLKKIVKRLNLQLDADESYNIVHFANIEDDTHPCKSKNVIEVRKTVA